MQSTQSLHRQHILPIGAQYTARHLGAPSSSSLTKIVLAEPRPLRVAECSIAWQTRIKAWNNALSHSTGVCVGDAERPLPTAVDGPVSASLPPTASEFTNAGPSTHNGPLPANNKPASSDHRHLLNQEGPTSTFSESSKNIKGNAEALPSFEDGTLAVITQSNALELIREVESDATLVRAVRAVISVLSREQVEHRCREIEASFRMEVLGLVQKSFSGVSSCLFCECV